VKIVFKKLNLKIVLTEQFFHYTYLSPNSMKNFQNTKNQTYMFGRSLYFF